MYCKCGAKIPELRVQFLLKTNQAVIADLYGVSRGHIYSKQYTMKAKKGDYIRILNRNGADWIKNGEVCKVKMVKYGPNYDEILVNGVYWSTQPCHYQIIPRFSDYLKEIER